MAPALFYFKALKAGEGMVAPVTFDIKNPMTTDNIAKFINSNLGSRLIKKPSPLANRNVQIGLATVLTIASTLAYFGKLLAIVYNPWLAMVLTMMFVVAMSSGAMFCRIRGIPLSLLSYAKKYNISHVLTYQTGAEAWVVGGLSTYHSLYLFGYLLALINATGMILLGSAVPKIKNPVGKRVATLIFTAVVAWGFSMHLQIFKTKLPSYPYKLLL